MKSESYDLIESEGDVPIKAWTRGVPVEDGAKAQLRYTSQLPVVWPHIAVMPDVHHGFGSTVGSVIPTLKAIIPAAVGVDIGCFVGETRVPLLDGTQATLEELAQRTESFWVYSSDDLLRVAPGRARCVRTRTEAELVRVVVSGGDEIVCTPDHQFRMYDGTYREARLLRPFDSLLPLYRRWEPRDGYEHVTTGKGRSKSTHTLVWEYLNGPLPKGHVVHHANHKAHDNRPENFERMTYEAHSSHHRRVGHQFDNGSSEFQALRHAGIRRRVQDPAKLAKMVAVGTKNITRFMAERPLDFSEAVAGNGRRGAPFLSKFNTSPRKCKQCDHIAANPGALRWHVQRSHATSVPESSNHKVISVEPLERRADVYCLQVEGLHNFALAAGVFVHNCGMVAARTTLTSHQLGDNAQAIFESISKAVPHGRSDEGGDNDRGAWGQPPNAVVTAWSDPAWGDLQTRFQRIVEKHPRLQTKRQVKQLGTLGTGNHFIEVCIDTEDRIWVMLHSGSRGIGNRIGSHFIAIAKDEMDRLGISMPNRDLAYLSEGTEHLPDYMEAVGWAQDYARINRELMLEQTLTALRKSGLPKFDVTDEVINCHHNYVQKEEHFGREVYLTRKGAVSARLGEMGIIPGSMGAKSFIVRGKGNAESFHTCSHGAGRVMSRTTAKQTITLAQHREDTEGIVCCKTKEVVDESPRAYKSIEAVMAAQADLVEIVHELKQIVCIKGLGDDGGHKGKKERRRADRRREQRRPVDDDQDP
jgi:tRNA-splicing ligase RtcB (3'-phosphate/5'-hydroxy nucleic acid ligase)